MGRRARLNFVEEIELEIHLQNWSRSIEDFPTSIDPNFKPNAKHTTTTDIPQTKRAVAQMKWASFCSPVDSSAAQIRGQIKHCRLVTKGSIWLLHTECVINRRNVWTWSFSYWIHQNLRWMSMLLLTDLNRISKCCEIITNSTEFGLNGFLFQSNHNLLYEQNYSF